MVNSSSNRGRQTRRSNPNVDDTLFGSRRTSSTKMAGKSMMVKPASKTVVSASNIRQMMARSVIITEEEQRLRQQQSDEAAQASKDVAAKRKLRMIEKEMQVRARREKIALQSELDAEKAAHLSDDVIASHQHLDSVKYINSLAATASAFKVREEQIQAAAARAEFEERYSASFDAVAERDRKAELSQRAIDREVQKQKRIEGRRMLEAQIAERERLAVRAEEAKALEAQKILELYKTYEAEDVAKAEAHREHVKQSVIEVAETNAKIQRMKKLEKQREARDELIAASYLRNKAAEEEAAAAEEARLHKAKEERTAKLRAQQEKVADKRAEQDALRAKRAWEAREKAGRKREADDKLKQQTLMENIMTERQAQEAFKARRVAAEKQDDVNAANRARAAVEDEARRRRDEAMAHAEANEGYKVALRRQIADNEMSVQKGKAFKEKEGALEAKRVSKEHINVNKIRERTIQKLKKEGVKEEYLKELRKMDPSSFQS